MWTKPAAEIEQELSPGEQFVWSGQPRGGVRLRAADWFLIPFSIFWCGFAIFWEVGALMVTAHAPDPFAVIFPLFGVPFVVIGLYLVFGRFLVDARIRGRTFYGITNERIVIVRGLFARRTKSLNLRTLSDISLSERSDRSGTITFGPCYPFGYWSFFGMWPGMWPGAGQYCPPAFDMIDDAKKVYDLVRQAQRAAT
jgi:hypothetical protein